jgi:hypothetical protein
MHGSRWRREETDQSGSDSRMVSRRPDTIDGLIVLDAADYRNRRKAIAP